MLRGYKVATVRKGSSEEAVETWRLSLPRRQEQHLQRPEAGMSLRQARS